jgi:hypothetical protein
MPNANMSPVCRTTLPTFLDPGRAMATYRPPVGGAAAVVGTGSR